MKKKDDPYLFSDYDDEEEFFGNGKALGCALAVCILAFLVLFITIYAFLSA